MVLRCGGPYQNFLHPDYFAVLARHRVAHIYDSWTEMPPLGEQLAAPGSLTNREFSGARLLVRPGRKFEQAVKLFSPYTHLQEPYEEARSAAVGLIQRVLSGTGPRTLFLYVGNRLEG